MRIFCFLNKSIVLFLSIYFSNGQLLELRTEYPSNGSPKGNGISDNNNNNYYHRVSDNIVRVNYTAAGTLQIPENVHVIIKRLPESQKFTLYVDRVNRPSYREEQMPTSGNSRLESRVIDFQMIVDFCDCSQTCSDVGRTPKPAGLLSHATSTRFDLIYEVSFNADNSSSLLYFSSVLKNIRVSNDHESVDMPGKLIIRKNVRKNFGPFGMPDINVNSMKPAPTGKRTKVKIVEEYELKKWIFQETDDNMETFSQWLRHIVDTNDYESISEHDETMAPKSGLSDYVDPNYVEVSMLPGYIVPLIRSDCVELGDLFFNFNSKSVIVNHGRCVRVYGGKKCSGSSRAVFQEGAVFYSEQPEEAAESTILNDIKSVTGCQDITSGYIFKRSRGNGPLLLQVKNPKRILTECPCSCNTTARTSTMADSDCDDPTAGRPPKTLKVTVPKWSELAVVQEVAAGAKNMARKQAVHASIAETLNGAICSARVTSHVALILVEVTFRLAELFDTVPRGYPNTMEGMSGWLKWMANKTAETADRAMSATPETASKLAWTVVEDVFDLGDYINEACKLAGSDDSAADVTSRPVASWRGRSGAVGRPDDYFSGVREESDGERDRVVDRGEERESGAREDRERENVEIRKKAKKEEIKKPHRLNGYRA